MTPQRTKFIFIIALFSCLIAPFNMDMFISGLPEIGIYFKTENPSLILSVSLLGIAVAQLFYGPLLDRFGRKPVLVTGLWIFTLASTETILVHSFSLFLVGRFVQAIGACSAITAAFATARDIYDKEKLINSIVRISKRLGGLETKTAINFLLEGNIRECFAVLLKYYDKWYLKGLHNRENLETHLINLPSSTIDPKTNASMMIETMNKLYEYRDQ